MTTKSHQLGNFQVAEVNAPDLVIHTAQDALDLMGSLYFQGFDSMILYQHQLNPAFFDLKNGMAGEILQKFSTYRMRLAIVGNFENYASKSLKDFIYESNKGRQVNFVPSLEDALERLSGK